MWHLELYTAAGWARWGRDWPSEGIAAAAGRTLVIGQWRVRYGR